MISYEVSGFFYHWRGPHAPADYRKWATEWRTETYRTKAEAMKEARSSHLEEVTVKKTEVKLIWKAPKSKRKKATA